MRQIKRIKIEQKEVFDEAKGKSPTFFQPHSPIDLEFGGDIVLNKKRQAFANREPEETMIKKKWYQCC